MTINAHFYKDTYSKSFVLVLEGVRVGEVSTRKEATKWWKQAMSGTWDKAAREERAAHARAINSHLIRRDHELYLNQMPRARGFQT
jgi:hypothetical protein